MSRYRLYGQGDERPSVLGDTQFTGVNEKLSRELLPPGTAARAINKRMRKGAAETRLGTITPAGPNVIDFTAVRGSGVYSNPNGLESLMIATPNMVWRISDGSTPRAVTLPEGTTLASASEFVQAFDKLLLFRGIKDAPLEWNGLAAGFTALPAPTDSTKTRIANADTAEVFKNRVLVPANRDDVQVSDILNYTQFDPILENWRINQGSADKLVRIYPYGNAGVVMFKETSILLLAGFLNPDRPDLASLEPLNDTIGLAARRSVVQAGADALFLSHTGIYRINQVLQDRTQTAPVPVSYPITPVIDRINWRAKESIVSAVLGEYAYWAVPLDGATTPNAMLVYNFATDNWETSYDQWSGPLSISNLHVALYNGERRLYALDYAARKIHVLYEGQTDLLEIGEYQIADLLETRGYTDNTGDPGLLNFRRARVAIATWNPSLNITALTDGVAEEEALTPGPVTRDPAKYFTFAADDYDPSNAGANADAPRRQDYTRVLDAQGFYFDEGVTLDLKQESVESAPIERNGRWLSLRIESTQGQCDVRGIEIEGNVAQRELRTAA